jgi:hypothetical protein
MFLIQRLERVYVYIFYVFVKSFADEWWAASVMALIEYLAIMGLVCGAALIGGHTPMAIPKVAVASGYFVTFAITAFALIRRNRWRRYKAEFEQYSKTKSTWARIAVWTGVLVTFLAAVDIIKMAIGGATN